MIATLIFKNINTMSFLTAQQIEYYQQNGYIVIDTGIDHSVLDTIIEELHDVWGNEDIKSLPVVHANRIQDAWKINKNIHEITIHQPILTALTELYPKQPLPFQTLNFRKGTEQSVHFDNMHFNSEPFGMMCGVWVAFEDIGPEQGPLIYYPGSNRWPEPDFSSAGVEAGDFKNYQVYLQKQIDESKIEPEYGTLKKGQALIWAASLLHGGSKQNDKTLSRYSQVTHYYFDECKYWRPTRSQHERKYFTPDWIPLDIDPQASAAGKTKTNLIQRISRLFTSRKNTSN